MPENQEVEQIETPTVEGVMPENQEVEQADAPKKTPRKKKEAVDGSVVMVPGTELRVGGIAVHSLQGEKEYDMTLLLPRRENCYMYLKEGVEMALRKESMAYQGVLNHPVDDEKETMVPVTFIGKQPIDLDRYEVFAAKCYYGLRGIKCADDLRTARIMVYKQLCQLLGLPVPTDDKIRSWAPLVLRKLSTPSGDTLIKQTKPIRFIDEGDVWVKKVIIEKK